MADVPDGQNIRLPVSGVNRGRLGKRLMPIRNDIRTEALLAQFCAQRDASRGEAKKASPALPTPVKVEDDRVGISLSGWLNVEAVNGILKDSVMEQFNLAHSDVGIDVSVREVERAGVDTSSEAAARRIAEFATGFLGAFGRNQVDGLGEEQIGGFLSVVRRAIDAEFQKAREFLEGIAEVTETIDESIEWTFIQVNELLDQFHPTQLDMILACRSAGAGESLGGLVS